MMRLFKSKSEQEMCKKRLMFIFGLFTFCCLIFVGRTSEYIITEFISCSHNYDVDHCLNCHRQEQDLSKPHKIPKRIHQIFFFETSSTLPEKLKNGQQTWLQRHPDYNYILWNKTSIDRLIDEEFPFLKHLYRSYGHWVRRADVARYVVLYHYGGWYVDLDVVCRDSLKHLEEEAYVQNKTVIVRETEPWGFSNDFIGITPNHPFLYTVLTSLEKSNRWYIFPYANTMFSTGPLFLWGRYLNFPGKDNFFTISNSTYSKYIDLLHNSSWHSWDGVIVWFLFKDPSVLFVILSSLFVVLCIVLVAVRFRAPLSAFFCKLRETRSHIM